MFIVMRLKPWGAISIGPAMGLPAGTPLRAPVDGSIGVLLVYATRAEAEAAWPGAALREAQRSNIATDKGGA